MTPIQKTTVIVRKSNIKIDIEKIDNDRFDVVIYNKKTHKIISTSRYWTSIIDEEKYFADLEKRTRHNKDSESTK